MTIISPFSLKDQSHSDPKGRFCIFDTKTNVRLFTLAALIYVSNDDNPAFLRVSLATCKILTCKHDFNLALNPEKDKKSGLAKTHTKSSNGISEHATNFN